MSAVLDRRVLAVEYVADHAQRPPGLVGRLGVGESRQALDGLEVSLVRPGHRVGCDGDVAGPNGQLTVLRQGIEYRDGVGNIERGKIKSWNDRFVFVVYRCEGEWNRFKDFIGAATDPNDLTFSDD